MIGIPYVLTHKDIIDYRAVIKRAIDIGWYPILDLQLLSLPYYNVNDKIRERSKGKTAEVAIVGYEDDGRKMYVRYFIDALYTEELIPCGDIFFGQQSPPPMQRRFRFIVPQKEKKSGFDITSVKKELHNYLFSLPVQTNGNFAKTKEDAIKYLALFHKNGANEFDISSNDVFHFEQMDQNIPKRLAKLANNMGIFENVSIGGSDHKVVKRFGRAKNIPLEELKGLIFTFRK